MSTRIPKAWETISAQEAIREERDRPAAVFRYDGHDVDPSKDVVYLVNRDAQCRAVDAALVQTEHWRVQDSLRGGAVPAACSKNIVEAPARRGLSEFRDGYWVGEGAEAEWRFEPYRSGCPGRARDIFDVMTDQVTRRGGASPFTAGQIFAAREYRDLHHRVHSAGVKPSRAFNAGDALASSGADVDFMDMFLAANQRLGWFHDAIGGVRGKDMRPVGAETAERIVVTDEMLAKINRKMITVRRVVDDVCIHERSLSEVLKAHGWGVTGKNRKSLREALCAALERMQGI